MHLDLTGGDVSQLKHAAQRIEDEATTWADGFAVRQGKELFFGKEGDFARERYQKLTSSAAYLRRLIARIGPTEPEYYI